MTKRENPTTNRNQDDRPLYRVSFSRITGQDRQGRDELARPKEIGAAWPRMNGKTGEVLQLDTIPIELVLAHIVKRTPISRWKGSRSTASAKQFGVQPPLTESQLLV